MMNSFFKKRNKYFFSECGARSFKQARETPKTVLAPKRLLFSVPSNSINFDQYPLWNSNKHHEVFETVQKHFDKP